MIQTQWSGSATVQHGTHLRGTTNKQTNKLSTHYSKKDSAE